MVFSSPGVIWCNKIILRSPRAHRDNNDMKATRVSLMSRKMYVHTRRSPAGTRAIRFLYYTARADS